MIRSEINRERWSPDVVIRSEERKINRERWSPDVVIRSEDKSREMVARCSDKVRGAR